MKRIRLFAASVLALLLASVVAHAQTVKVNNVACDAGSSVTFGAGEINVNAVGACTNTTAPAPTLSGLSVATANVGDTVTATGTGFSFGNTTVRLNATVATNVSVTSGTSLTFTVPASMTAGNYNVTVSVGAQTSGSQVLMVTVPLPTVSGFVPTSAKPGDTVQVNGTNFVNGATVTVGGISAPTTFVSATRLDVVVPAVAATSQPVIVTVGGNASMPTNLMVTAAVPAISSFNPASATVGSNVAITGTGFAPGATVTIGGVAATIVGVPTATTINVTVPTLTGLPNSFTIQVTVAGVSASSLTGLMVSAPSANVPTVSACTGTVGSSFTITGTNFAAPATVTMGGNSVTSPVVASSTSITGTVPAAITAAGMPAVIVTVASQSSTSFNCTISAAPTGAFGERDVSNNLIPTPVSRVANSVMPAHVGANGGGNTFGREVRGWSVPVASCNATPALSTVWYHNIDIMDFGRQSALEYFDFAPNQAITYSFIAQPNAANSQVGVVSFFIGPTGSPASTFVSISPNPCDFNTARVAAADPCYKTGGGENGITFQVTTNPTSPVCKLNPNERYFLNIRFQDAAGAPSVDACANQLSGGSQTCGTLMKIQTF
ncbi:MAG: IPT/TIG domain-containing protein [Betaproteobacteria bacterium]|nr:IPT/TIG domain-containing protein [Betaproteobacteria bacterium]